MPVKNPKQAAQVCTKKINNIIKTNLIFQEKLKDDHIKAIDAKFKQLSDFIGEKKFLMGSDITIADFQFYDAIKWHQKLDSELVAKYKNVSDYITNLEAHPKIKSFMESNKYFKPIFSPAATWNPSF